MLEINLKERLIIENGRKVIKVYEGINIYRKAIKLDFNFDSDRKEV